MEKIQSIFQDTKLNKREKINLLILIMISSGILGFIYEEIFYRIDLGYFTKRGSTFGPWIPIYLFGGLFITLITYQWKKHPLLVFLGSLIITGVLEYLTGYVLYHFFHTRLWDYNVEILNFGNINGYICLRSVLLFAFAGIFLIYIMIPLFIKLIQKSDAKIMNKICNILMVLFLLDVIIYHIVK